MPDVVIVGAGPVGMVAALELIARGVDVQVIERRAQPRKSSRSIGLHPPALRVLERLGCGAPIIRAGVQIRVGEARCGGVALGRLSFQDASASHPYVLSVPQHITEHVLRTRLAEVAPDALVTGCAVTGAHQSDSGVDVETERGLFRAKWVIGADGPRSVMRALGGFPIRRRAYRDRYVMGDATDDTDLGERALLYLEGDGVVESFPLPGGQRRWVVHRGADATPVDVPEFARLVQRRTRIRLDAADILATSAFGVHHVWASSAVRGRIALLGDAAHEISPIGGQGMTLGWLDAVEFASALTEVVSGGSRASLTAYQAGASRRHRVAARQALFNTAMGRPRHGAALAARNLAIRAIAHPVFERRVAAAFTMAAPAETVRS